MVVDLNMTMPQIQTRDVIIIGAGASGFMCAMACGARGRRVLVLDHAARTCAKIRISGGGRCNFTNLSVTPDHYASRNPHFCKSALARFTPGDILALMEKHHLPYFEKEAGQLFCSAGSLEMVSMLERECLSVGVETLLNCRITDLGKSGMFTVETTRGAFASESLVVATGGLSYPNLGASGFGHEAARKFGLDVTQLRPALVPFVFTAQDRQLFGGLAGISLEAAVTCGGRTFRGNVLFTHRGLSGPAALQASLCWTQGEALTIDLLPGRDILSDFIARRGSNVELPNLLSEFLPRRFAHAWCGTQGAEKPLNQTAEKNLDAIARMIHAWEILPRGTEGYATAEVTAGGVNTDEISSKTMEAKKVPGLYFVGEVLDVTGELGGYNLHWAWASGHIAGQYA